MNKINYFEILFLKKFKKIFIKLFNLILKEYRNSDSLEYDMIH